MKNLIYTIKTILSDGLNGSLGCFYLLVLALIYFAIICFIINKQKKYKLISIFLVSSIIFLLFSILIKIYFAHN